VNPGPAASTGWLQRLRTGRPASILTWAALAYVGALAVAAIAVRGLADVWWPATVLAYAPRWLLALPLPFAALALWVAGRRKLLWSLLPAAIALGAAVDFRIPVSRASAGSDSSAVVLVTLNAGYRTTVDQLRQLLQSSGAQVAALQECDPPIAEAADSWKRDGWQVHREASLCLLSRFPIRKVDVLDPTEIRRQGGNGVAVHYLLDAPSGPLDITSVHLQTVRDGLDEVIHRAWRGSAALAANTAARDNESRRVRAWIDERRGTNGAVVVGDFNMPVESAVFRRHWGSLGNAFSRAGFGLGWSKRTRWHGVRIDHVLFSDELDCARAYIGDDAGSDHRPVIVRLIR
jgi:vancomycin resistance protein VanJ